MPDSPPSCHHPAPSPALQMKAPSGLHVQALCSGRRLLYRYSHLARLSGVGTMGNPVSQGSPRGTSHPDCLPSILPACFHGAGRLWHLYLLLGTVSLEWAQSYLFSGGAIQTIPIYLSLHTKKSGSEHKRANLCSVLWAALKETVRRWPSSEWMSWLHSLSNASQYLSPLLGLTARVKMCLIWAGFG